MKDEDGKMVFILQNKTPLVLQHKSGVAHRVRAAIARPPYGAPPGMTIK